MFRKIIANVRKHCGIKLLTKVEKRSHLTSETNYRKKQFCDKKTSFSRFFFILDLIEVEMYKFWHDSKNKCSNKAKLC